MYRYGGRDFDLSTLTGPESYIDLVGCVEDDGRGTVRAMRDNAAKCDRDLLRGTSAPVCPVIPSPPS